MDDLESPQNIEMLRMLLFDLPLMLILPLSSSVLEVTMWMQVLMSRAKPLFVQAAKVMAMALLSDCKLLMVRYLYSLLNLSSVLVCLLLGIAKV